MIDFQARHWGIALVTALAAHGAMLGFFWETAPSGARSAGLGGIEVSLGAAGSAPGAEAAVPPAAVAPVQPPQAVDSVDARPVTVEEPPDPVEKVERVETVEPIEIARLEETRPILMVPLPKVKPRPPKRPEPKPQVIRPAEPERTPAVTPEEPVKPVEPGETEPAKAPPVAPGADGRSGTKAEAETGSGETRSGGGLPGVSTDYMSLLQAWLEKHKEYPRMAQARRQEGAALLWFAIDPEGRVLEFSIRRSSGYASLDREVLAMIKRASPLPRMPDDMSRDRLEVVVPVQFRLR